MIHIPRGALTPYYGELTTEAQHQKYDDDEFVMIERVSDSLRVLGLDKDDWSDAQFGGNFAVSAETTATELEGVKIPGAHGKAHYDHLPVVPMPKLMQTPQNIPSLSPFSRIIVYVLISPDAGQGPIKSDILKGSSTEETFKLNVPVDVLSERGESIHQFAAKKAVAELEEGRGWLMHAKDET